MTGYVRNDIANNITPGASAQAEDIDGEFDALVAAFNSISGHTHNGSPAEGAPITVVGPTQDVEVTSTEIEPSSNNAIDLGTATNKFKNAYLSGNITIEGTVDGRDIALDGAALDDAETAISSLETRMSTAETDITDIETLNSTQNSRLTAVENKNTTQDSTLSSHGTRLTNVESKNTTQDTTLSSLQSQINALTNSILNKIYPVGSLYTSTSSANPATHLGIGTWEAYAQGRALVGVGTADGVAYSGGTQRGINNVTLATSQIPFHNHSNGSLAVSGTTDSGGKDFWFEIKQEDDGTNIIPAASGLTSSNISDSDAWLQRSSSGDRQRLTYDAAHGHSFSANVSGFTSGAGGGGAHTNIQPSIGVYVWRRVG